MTRHRSHNATFKRQVAQEFIGGETLRPLSKRRDISRQLIRIWVGKFEAGAFDDEERAAYSIQEYEAKVAALERMVGRKAREIDPLYKRLCPKWPLRVDDVGFGPGHRLEASMRARCYPSDVSDAQWAPRSRQMHVHCQRQPDDLLYGLARIQ